jgi:hypothetical protein
MLWMGRVDVCRRRHNGEGDDLGSIGDVRPQGGRGRRLNRGGFEA